MNTNTIVTLRTRKGFVRSMMLLGFPHCSFVVSRVFGIDNEVLESGREAKLRVRVWVW